MMSRPPADELDSENVVSRFAADKENSGARDPTCKVSVRSFTFSRL
jgi:hypothetical protein